MDSTQGWMEIGLDVLEAHPSNSNAMPSEAYQKLKAHLAVNDRYPPLIVRPLRGDRFQLLDGHHRAQALRELGRASARCDVWDVDEGEALVLLATLNRLRGRDDPRRRAALLHELTQRFGGKALSTRLPETPEKLKRLAALHGSRPTLRKSEGLADMPVAVHFFFKPADKRRLEAALRGVMQREALSREAALLRCVERAFGGEQIPDTKEEA